MEPAFLCNMSNLAFHISLPSRSEKELGGRATAAAQERASPTDQGNGARRKGLGGPSPPHRVSEGTQGRGARWGMRVSRGRRGDGDLLPAASPGAAGAGEGAARCRRPSRCGCPRSPALSCPQAPCASLPGPARLWQSPPFIWFDASFQTRGRGGEHLRLHFRADASPVVMLHSKNTCSFPWWSSIPWHHCKACRNTIISSAGER